MIFKKVSDTFKKVSDWVAILLMVIIMYTLTLTFTALFTYL